MTMAAGVDQASWHVAEITKIHLSRASFRFQIANPTETDINTEAINRHVRIIDAALDFLPQGLASSPAFSVADLGGDPHNGVFPLHFRWSTGEQWIFKPRSAGCEFNLNSLLRESGEQVGLVWPAYRSIQCPGSSWSGVLSYDRHLAPDKAAQYYYASGVLLAWAHILRMSDLNHENVIVHHGYPMVVDAEFLFQPSLAQLMTNEVRSSRISLEESVMNTLMLPLPGEQRDWGALGNAAGSSNASGKSQPSQHLLFAANGIRFRPVEFLPEIRRGFASMYRHVMQSKHWWIDRLNQMTGDVRIAIRPTQAYVRAQTWLDQQRAVLSSDDRVYLGLYKHLESTLFYGPGGTSVWGPKKRHSALFRNLLHAETAQLLDGDIPYFSVDLKGCTLSASPAACLGQFTTASPLDQTCNRIRYLNSRDLDLQVRTIEECLLSTQSICS